MAALDQVLRNSQAKLLVTFFVNGSATDADGNVTVTVLNPDGTIFDGPETAEDDTPGDGTYEYLLDAQSDLTKFQLNWTGIFGGVSQTVTTFAEVIGGHLFTVNEVRAFRDGKLSDANKYPTADIIDAREEVSQQFERYCQVSFIPRYRREVIDGNGKDSIYLDRREIRKVQKVVEDGVTLTEGTDYHVYRSGRLKKDGAAWSSQAPRNVVVDYEHGYEIPPGPISRAGMIVLQNYLVGSDLHDRKIFQQDESGIFRLSFPDATNRRPTGIPHVDTRLNEYAEPWGIS